MSGRKDYSYDLAADRIAAQKTAILARRAERSRQTRARLESAKSNAKQRAAELGWRQRASNQQRMQQAAESSRLAIELRGCQPQEPAEQAAKQESELAGLRTAADAKQNSKQETQRQCIAEIAAAEAAELQTEIENQMQAILQWQQSFQENEDVNSFASDQLASWQKSVQQSFDAIASSDPSAELLSDLQQATAAAEALASKAGDLSDQFFARNSVMTDIIASLKEIGFFVQDPEFVDANHPEGAVIIRANRGNENLTTSVSLDQNVESDWQGIHGQYCTGSFFEYVKAMDGRGIKITPNDSSLKPKLLQKGAKHVPDGRQRSAGSN